MSGLRIGDVLLNATVDGSVGRMMGTHRDINAEKTLQRDKEDLQLLIETRTKELNELNHQLNIKIREVEYLATTDSLTLLFNRPGFEKKLKSESAKANRFNEPLSLIAFDLA